MRQRVIGRLALVVVLLVAACCILAWWAMRDTADRTGPNPLAGASEESAEDLEPPQLRTQGETPAATKPVKLSGDGRIRGVVLDMGDRPVAGVLIVARRSPRVGGRGRFERVQAPVRTEVEVARARSDERGRFRLEGFETTTARGAPTLPPHYVVEAVVPAPRTSSQAFVANWGKVRTYAIVLRVFEGVAARGRVVDAEDRPVSAVVRARAQSGDGRPRSYSAWAFGPQATDAEGRFVMAAVPRAASLQFDVLVPGRVAARGLYALISEKGEYRLRLDGGGRITGRVVSSDDAPIAEARCSHRTAARWNPAM